ncbi:hypothetical protein RHGRI_016900 [Rhododendron griersonianum]|uniref:Trehalose 6-phosphate phosphatase n=1 Tax=Rhododendron griersonianum TaxID=479676 RepID=A0AAV6JVY0_9ERIC|nr:hypothetical protein RHGRI_016900 [Rhododendron griersonianum]
MTNQNVVVSDAKSGIGMTITAPAKSSSLFPAVVPKPPPAAAARYITISRKKPSKKLETAGGGARIMGGNWVDSMRDSSPTRKPTSPFSQSDQDHIRNSWMSRYPSALGMFEQIIKASNGKQIVMFLDYDGTLSPIVEDPDRAFMTNEMREAVRDVAKYFPTAIVTGRCRAKVYNFVRLSQLYYAGSHGMDIRGPANGSKHRKGNHAVLFQPAREFLPMIDEVYKALLEKTKSTPGAMVENNKFCVSVHYRCVDEKSWSALAEQVKSVLNEYPKLRLTPGRKVQYEGYTNSNEVFPIYIGDDRTDEDAFKVLRDRGQGFGILVSKVPKETNASYSLQEPSEASYGLSATFGGMEAVSAIGAVVGFDF